MLWRIAALLFLAAGAQCFCPDYFKNQTACSCADFIDGAVIKCSGPASTAVVEKLKTTHVEIRELTLESANIVEIGARAFKNLRIKKLVLDKNRIKALHPDAFAGLETVMVELSMQQNRLTEVPTEALSGLRSLNVLNLRCNKIGNLTEPLFSNNSALIDVNLACNQICHVGAGVFDSVKMTLQDLILDSNCLEQFPGEAVQDMSRLIALHLKYNNIQTIGPKSMTNLTSLSMLTLTGNNISTIDKEAIVNTPNLRYLYLAENVIRGFEAGTMAQFKQAQVIDLSFNEIDEITVDTFANMESLQHMNLESNHIREVAPGAFSGTPLLLLWLPYNCISSVNPNMFQGAPFLRQISLANNNIHDIQPLSFAHLANLHTLDLSFNKIVSLQNGAITGADYLTVRLQENPMVCGQDGFHVMTGNEPVNLTSEANIVCRGDWQSDVPDLCPKDAVRPVPPTCCNKPMPLQTTSTTEMPSTTLIVETTPEEEEEVEEEETEDTNGEQQGNEEGTDEEVEETDEEDEQEETETTPAPTKKHRKTTKALTTTTEEPTTTTPKRKVNMERFWRLAHRPNANSPFMRHHAQIGKAAPTVLKSKSASSEEVASTTPAEEEGEEEEEEGSEEEYEEEEESTTATTTTRPTRRIPSRVMQRQKMLNALPPWISTNKSKSSSHQQPEIDFDRDDATENVQVDQPAH